jgi:hypothetical protein
VSQPQTAPSAGFADFLAEAATRLDAAIDGTIQTVKAASPAEATEIAHKALEELRSARETFEANFGASIERLERLAAGSHEPVPHEDE